MGNRTGELLAVNMVLAICKPEYVPVLWRSVLVLTDARFNCNTIKATTHVVAHLVVVNGAVVRWIGMNAGGNVVGSGNCSSATIGRALRLILLIVGGGIPTKFDKSTLDTHSTAPRTKRLTRGRRIASNIDVQHPAVIDAEAPQSVSKVHFG